MTGWDADTEYLQEVLRTTTTIYGNKEVCWIEADRKVRTVRLWPPKVPLYLPITNRPEGLVALVRSLGKPYLRLSQVWLTYIENPFGCGLIADWLEEHTDQLQPAPEPKLLQAICTELRRGLQPVG